MMRELSADSVHTLRFGDSPLTMRLARQLDIVGLSAIDVIGRVRLGAKRKPAKGFRLVIGTIKEDIPMGGEGILALAAYRRYTFNYPWWIELGDEEKVTICSRARYDPIGRHWVQYVVDEGNPHGVWHLFQRGGLVLEIDTRNVDKCDVDHFHHDQACDPLWSWGDVLDEDVKRQIQDGKAEQQLHAQAGKSPLIALP